LLIKDLTRMAKLRADVTEAEWDHLVSAKTDAEANVRVLEQKLQLMKKPHRAERLQAAEAEVLQARALLEKAKTNLDHATLRAPFAGVVLERKAEVGENVRPDAMATGLCVLADMSELEVRVDVEEQSLGKLYPGQPCRIIPDAFPDQTYAARVSRWQLQVNRARAVVHVILSIDEPDAKLLSEMNCRAIILNTSEGNEQETFWVPALAVVTDGGESVVYVADEGAARRRPVKVGETREKDVQILEGLSQTDVLVLPGKTPIADGEQLR
jgi:RND family efflux transporter MFP subunit